MSIVSSEQVRTLYPDMDADMIALRISAVESFIKIYTSNDFIDRTTGMVVWPADVQIGALNLLSWDVGKQSRAGIASESISRHSISYVGQEGYVSGYPASELGFLTPYIKARF